MYAKHQKPVIPIVVHQGAKKLKKRLCFQDTLKDMTPTVRRHFGKIVLNFTCLPVDIQRLNWKGEDLTAGPIFYIMAQIRRMSIRTLEEFARLCEGVKNRRIQQILVNEGSDYLNLCDPKKFSWDRIREVLTGTLSEGETIMKRMTFSQERAKEEGREEGREEVALLMLAEGMDIATICKCTKLTREEIEALKVEKQAA